MKLSSSLPKGNPNGLISLEPTMCNRPEDTFLVVARITCKQLTTDVDSGDIEATARIHSIEWIRDEADRAMVAEAATRRLEERIGAPLPGVGTVVVSSGIVAPETGEVL